MKSHLTIALGLLIGAIFVWRALDAFSVSGFGLREIYILGGFALAGALVWSGLKARRRGP